MFCPRCGTRYTGNFCNNCGYSENMPQPPVNMQQPPIYWQQPPQKKSSGCSGCLIGIFIAFGIFIFFTVIVGSIASNGNDEKNNSSSFIVSEQIDNNSSNNSSSKKKTESDNDDSSKPKSDSQTDSEIEEKEIDESYESNSYYDIVEEVKYNNSIGYTVLIQKVSAKKSGHIQGSIVVKSNDGKVIGKDSCLINLTKGQYNYFKYTFESDITDAELITSIKTVNTYTSDGEENAVEMTDYNVTTDLNNKMYITFKQVKKMGEYSEFKILFYKNDTIISAEEGHFASYAENLNGINSSDVAEIWIEDPDFDRIEYIYEP